jgi:hypothetical protein
MSQTKRAAPAAAACLLNRFQLAWARAATAMRTRAVAFRLAASCTGVHLLFILPADGRCPLPLPVG